MCKEEIFNTLKQMEKSNEAQKNTLQKRAFLTDYSHLAYNGTSEGKSVRIWTKALQTALLENEIVEIPAQKDTYYLDSTVVIPSNRCIIAEENAVISLTDTTSVLMLRNEHVKDGTHAPIATHDRDNNIFISGGTVT